MANIIINGFIGGEGLITVGRRLERIEGTNQKKLIVEGSLKSATYYEEIDTIETDRFSVIGVQVYEEFFASEEAEILYNFRAEKIIVNE